MKPILPVFATVLICSLLQSTDIPADALPSIDVPRLAVAPQITADPADPGWRTAVTIPGLGLSRRNPVQPFLAKGTAISLGWDPGFLYVRFTCEDDSVHLPVQGRDAELYRGDAVEVFLDVVGDGAAVIELQFSPGGDAFDQVILLTRPLSSQEDGLMSADLRNRDLWMDRSWNMEGLRWVARRSDSGWMVDAAIPAASALRRLGHGTWRPLAIRANLLRYEWMPVGTGRDLLAMNWSTVQYGCPHLSPARMGTLRLVDR